MSYQRKLARTDRILCGPLMRRISLDTEYDEILEQKNDSDLFRQQTRGSGVDFVMEACKYQVGTGSREMFVVNV